MRICWADDHADQARLFSRTLQAADVSITFAEDGEEALAALQSAHYDALVTDLQMPPGQWGGLWLLRELRDVGLSVPTVVLSGEGSQQETIQAMRLGAADYVTKDDAASELLPRLSALLGDVDRALLGAEESERLEFKSTLRADVVLGGTPSKDVEHAVLKTLAGFANSVGGQLVIGRGDAGRLIGLGPDLQTLTRSNRDGWELHLRNIVSRGCGVHVNQLVSVRFTEVDECTLAFISVSPAPEPVFTRKGKEAEAFYIRAGNQTVALSTAEAMRYQRQRWR